MMRWIVSFKIEISRQSSLSSAAVACDLIFGLIPNPAAATTRRVICRLAEAASNTCWPFSSAWSSELTNSSICSIPASHIPLHTQVGISQSVNWDVPD